MTDSAAGLVDIAQPTTWPGEVRTTIAELATRVREHPDFRDDLPAYDLPSLFGYDESIEYRLREMLGEHRIAMYHGTRLLPHEFADLEATGLQPLSAELRRRRAERAHQHHGNLLGADDVELLLANGPLRWQRGAVRLGLLHVVAPLHVMSDDGMSRLLSTWGGESLYWHDSTDAGPRCDEIIRRLTAASTPAVVCVGPRASDLATRKDLWPEFVGVLAELDHGNEWTMNSGLSRLEIFDIMQPGHPHWRAE
jgi:hypothetical protein